MDKIYLRKVKASDMDIFYAWRNEDEVRKNSFTEDWVKYREHEKWFIAALNNPNEEIWVMCLNDERIGQIRLTHKDDAAYITYSVALEYRGHGYGKIMLYLLENEIFDIVPRSKLIGEVKKDNVASQIVFMSCGYKKTEKENMIVFDKYPQKNDIENQLCRPSGGGSCSYK